MRFIGVSSLIDYVDNLCRDHSAPCRHAGGLCASAFANALSGSEGKNADDYNVIINALETDKEEQK